MRFASAAAINCRWSSRNKCICGISKMNSKCECCFTQGVLTHLLRADCFPLQLYNIRGFVHFIRKNNKNKQNNAALKFGDSMHVNTEITHDRVLFQLSYQYRIYAMFKYKLFSNMNILFLVCYSVPSCQTNMVAQYTIAYHRARPIWWLSTL